jgi:hypothetical protein
MNVRSVRLQADCLNGRTSVTVRLKPDTTYQKCPRPSQGFAFLCVKLDKCEL